MLVAAPTSQKLVVAVVTTRLVTSVKPLVEKLPLAPIPAVTWTMLLIPVVFHVINRSVVLVGTIDVVWKDGVYNSALDRKLLDPSPPATSTSPLGSNVAV